MKNTEGIPLRLWVNPKEGRTGIEPLVKQPIPPVWKRDCHRIAAHQLEQHLETELEEDELEELAYSVAKQWQQYEGHACLFLDEEQQLVFTLTEQGDGYCKVAGTKLRVNLAPVLSSIGTNSDAIPEVIARINLGQEIEFRDKKAVPFVLWHDPKIRQVVVRALHSPSGPPQTTTPIFCPKCSGVLSFWREGERQQTCPLCGHLISL